VYQDTDGENEIKDCLEDQEIDGIILLRWILKAVVSMVCGI